MAIDESDSYFCTECGHNHRRTSNVGIDHAEFERLEEPIEEATELFEEYEVEGEVLLEMEPEEPEESDEPEPEPEPKPKLEAKKCVSPSVRDCSEDTL